MILYLLLIPINIWEHKSFPDCWNRLIGTQNCPLICLCKSCLFESGVKSKNTELVNKGSEKLQALFLFHFFGNQYCWIFCRYRKWENENPAGPCFFFFGFFCAWFCPDGFWAEIHLDRTQHVNRPKKRNILNSDGFHANFSLVWSVASILKCMLAYLYCLKDNWAQKGAWDTSDKKVVG